MMVIFSAVAANHIFQNDHNIFRLFNFFRWFISNKKNSVEIQQFSEIKPISFEKQCKRERKREREEKKVSDLPHN